MALFKRANLKAQGLTDEQIEFVMTEGNRSLANNYTLTSDVQGKIDAAVQAAQTTPADVTQSPEYQNVVNERDMLRAIGGDDFASVKPPLRISSKPSANSTRNTSRRPRPKRRPQSRASARPRRGASRPARPGRRLWTHGDMPRKNNDERK